MGFYRLFYKKDGQQKKWLIIPTVLLPIVFSFWGILLSKQANNLAHSANSNRDQIDTLTSIVKELRSQNELLGQSVAIQQDQYNVDKDQQVFARRPKLSVAMISGDLSDQVSNIVIHIHNTGGPIHSLKYKLPTGVTVDSSVLVYDSQLSEGGKISNIAVNGLRNGSTIRFSFTDELGSKYFQELKWRYGDFGDDLNFGPLITQSK